MFNKCSHSEFNPGMGWDGLGWVGLGWVGMGWDGMGWDEFVHKFSQDIVRS